LNISEIEDPTTTTTTTTTTTGSMTSHAFYHLLGQNEISPYFNYAKYTESADDSQNKNDDYYYDDYTDEDDDSCGYCKTKSERVTFNEFCKNDYGIYNLKIV
jgi:hypothetical protein